jgi:DNA-binding CsgD family transcriptional regulator
VAGEASQDSVAEPWAVLSPQEMHIARLVAERLSNREIAERLYLSHRTVASHLYRIFPKLDITSRAQLRNRLQWVTALAPGSRPSAAPTAGSIQSSP